MRILHFVPDIGVANGVMSVVLNYFKAMPDDIKFDVMYFMDCEKDRRADIESLGGRVFKISPLGIKSLISPEIDSFFEEHKGEYEAVHIHVPYMSLFIAPKAKRHGIKKIAVHCHSSVYSLISSNTQRNRLLNIPTKLMATKLFACGKNAGRFWYKNSDFTVVPNAIDCSAYAFSEEKRRSKRDELLLSETQLAVGHIGMTEMQVKNHPYVLRVFAKLRENNPDAVLLLVGAEPTEELEVLSKELNIKDGVRFLGRRNDVPELLSAMDILLFPSFNEGLPVSVIEAQAAGLPVLMSDTVTDEVCITDGIKRLSIEADPTVWAKQAADMPAIDRPRAYEKVKNSGWDIFDCASKLADYYGG